MTSGNESERADATPDGVDRQTLLLVDDTPLNLQVLMGVLEDLNHTLLVARSGEQAIAIAQKVRPALILLDIMMPGMDGYETCERLKSDERTRDCAIIFLSALQEPADKVRGLALGAVDYVTKPFDADEVIARVQRQLALHTRQRALTAENLLLQGQLDSLRKFDSDTHADRSAWVASLIRGGENDRVEFKSTLRWNLRSDQADKGVDLAWLKAIVAFLNTDGGVLIVGVEDDGNVLGTAADRFDNDDKYLLHVNNRINQHIGMEHLRDIRFGLVSLGDDRVLVVECLPSRDPVFLMSGNAEDFYVRAGPGSRKLSTSEVLAYMSRKRG